MAEDGKKIGVVAATVIGINAMIGAGIFAMPAKLANVVGPASILSYVLVSLVILSIVFPLGRLAQLHPGEGWGYRYPALWGGHTLGMLTSVFYMSGVIVAMGFLVQQMGVWMAQYLPFCPTSIGVGLLGAIVALVLAGTQISEWGQYVIAICVLAPLGLTSLLCWLNMKPGLLTPFAPFGVSAVFTSLPVVIFSLLGFESIASLYRIVRDPQKNVPRAAIAAVVIVVGMYILFVTGAMAAIGREYFAAGVDQAFSDVLVQVLPQYGFMRSIISIGAFFGIFGTLHSMIWSVAELFLDVARKARNCAVTGFLSRGLLTERVCILIVGGATLMGTLLFKADIIFALVPLFIVPAYLLSVIALLVKKSEWQNGHNFMALAALLSSVGMIYLSVQNIADMIL